MILKPRPFRKPRRSKWKKNLVGLWLMNEGSGNIVQDLSGNGNILTESGGVVWTAGKFGPASRFGGDNEYYTAPDSSSLDITGALTIVMWMRADSLVGDDAGLISKSADIVKYFSTNVNKSYEIGVLNNTIYFQVSNGSASDLASVAFAGYLDGQWHQIVAVFDPLVRCELYIDNVLVNADGALVVAAIQNLASVLDIGGYTTTYNLSGDIDHILLYNRALSARERQQLYRGPSCFFDRDPIELWTGAMGGGGAPTGNAGIMTCNTGYWGI